MELAEVNNIGTYGLLAGLALFLLAIGRYFFLAGLAYLVCYYPGWKSLQRFKIQPKDPSRIQIRHELRYSLSTALIFSAIGILVLLLYLNGYTTLYTNPSEHGWAYLLLTLACMIVFHDAYFYWTHRLLHTPWLFRKIHSVHHRSVNPTPWAAYAFHPLEALLEALVVFPIITVFPVHLGIFILFTFIVVLMNVLGHLGFEFMPETFRNGKGSWLTSSTHHNLHHQLFHWNYGYYFTWWDRWLKTLRMR
ncbi:MAG: sterol desaturase family protein [Cyclobacteriaceae bacterium]|nr:sterol desaturase family protein [Cyclobacteriaceae bacterium]